MVQLWLVASLVVIGAGEATHPPKADPNKCTCPKAKIHNGWCARCKVGYAASVKVPSASLARAGQAATCATTNPAAAYRRRDCAAPPTFIQTDCTKNDAMFQNGRSRRFVKPPAP